jgi:hypothetical protein
VDQIIPVAATDYDRRFSMISSGSAFGRGSAWGRARSKFMLPAVVRHTGDYATAKRAASAGFMLLVRNLPGQLSMRGLSILQSSSRRQLSPLLLSAIRKGGGRPKLPGDDLIEGGQKSRLARMGSPHDLDQLLPLGSAACAPIQVPCLLEMVQGGSVIFALARVDNTQAQRPI